MNQSNEKDNECIEYINLEKIIGTKSVDESELNTFFDNLKNQDIDASKVTQNKPVHKEKSTKKNSEVSATTKKKMDVEVNPSTTSALDDDDSKKNKSPAKMRVKKRKNDDSVLPKYKTVC